MACKSLYTNEITVCPRTTIVQPIRKERRPTEQFAAVLAIPDNFKLKCPTCDCKLHREWSFTNSRYDRELCPLFEADISYKYSIEGFKWRSTLFRRLPIPARTDIITVSSYEKNLGPRRGTEVDVKSMGKAKTSKKCGGKSGKGKGGKGKNFGRDLRTKGVRALESTPTIGDPDETVCEDAFFAEEVVSNETMVAMAANEYDDEEVVFESVEDALLEAFEEVDADGDGLVGCVETGQWLGEQGEDVEDLICPDFFLELFGSEQANLEMVTALAIV